MWHVFGTYTSKQAYTMKILNHHITAHFRERMQTRNISEFLISLCIVKGEIKKREGDKTTYSLHKEQIMDAISQGYITIADCLFIKSITIIAKKNTLITTFVKLGDTGIKYIN